MNETVYIETKYKDTLFRMLFKEKTRLLELYNAINNAAIRGCTKDSGLLHCPWNIKRFSVSQQGGGNEDDHI